MARLSSILCLALALVTSTCGFVQPSGPAAQLQRRASSKTVTSMAYIPDGLSKEQWAAIQKKDSNAGKELAKNGAKGFKSRSFKSFQASLERGDENAKNFSLFDAKKKLARGEIKVSDIPYMQRPNGAWDNTDVAKRGSKLLRKRTADDAEYEANPDKFMDFFSMVGRNKKTSGQQANSDQANSAQAAPKKKTWWQK